MIKSEIIVSSAIGCIIALVIYNLLITKIIPANAEDDLENIEE